MTILLFCIGLILIIKGGDMFVESSVNIARATHLPEIFIGATIVSIATTTPEGIVSITAAAKGYTSMSIGNAIGSTICNTGLVLGFSNIIIPGKIKGRFFKMKSVLIIVYFIIIIILSYDGLIDISDSIILLILLFVYIILEGFVLKYKKNQNLKNNKMKIGLRGKFEIFLSFTIGLLGIVIGSNLLINNGVILAEFIGVPESVISLSIIALGTSLPELTTALTALKKGHTALSVGNVIGANILNITLVIGVSGIVNPLKVVKQNLFLDFPVSFLMILILTIPCFLRNRISRVQSAFLLFIYVAYITILYRIYL
ncbi:calcium/sodium antiporter [Maledivibacter halophilus]|nr:calcium/sodium antiporter [Maledivibacter halophilus]